MSREGTASPGQADDCASLLPWELLPIQDTGLAQAEGTGWGKRTRMFFTTSGGLASQLRDQENHDTNTGLSLGATLEAGHQN